MGLTIHYTFAAGDRPLPEVRQIIKKLRHRALDLPFNMVSEVLEFTGKDCQFIRGVDDDHGWLKCQAARLLTQVINGQECGVHINPTHIIAFTMCMSDGSEPANIGLCQYPPTAVIEGQQVPTVPGWAWRSFCKTQYASDPTLGGIKNFLKAHLGLVAVLDYANDLGILTAVDDEGDYWVNRDVPALVQTVGSWNEMVAGLAGQMKDLVGPALQSHITSYPNFEHLEAKGREEHEL